MNPDLSLLRPHVFENCTEPHLYSRGAHCAWCDLPEDHDIHKVGDGAPVERTERKAAA